MDFLVKFSVFSLLVVCVRTEKCEDTGIGCIYVNCDASYLQDYIKGNCRKSCNLCNDIPDSLRGTWTGWNYGSCSKSCGGGTQTGYRRCVSGYCSGSYIEEVDCNTQPCNAIQPIWSRWNLGSCSVTCGKGQRQDTRVCLKGICVGMTTRWVECVERDCPVWGDWLLGDCSVTCGLGSREDKRYCLQGICEGNGFRTMQCEVGVCPVWTNWSLWTSCSVTCERGRRERTRTCTGGGCMGNSKEWEYCVEQQVCTGEWSDWSESGSCSVTCGEGTIEMTRSCPTGNCVGLSSKYVTCEITPCQVIIWSDWGSWGSCSVTCGDGTRERIRTCPQWNSCEGESREVESCSDTCGSTPVWSNWGQWNGCSRTCGSGSRSRYRTCSVSDGCPGDNQDNDNCPDNTACPTAVKCEDKSIFCFYWISSCYYYPSLMKDTCAKTCNYCEEVEEHEWSEWENGECSITCGSGGIMKQTRTCLRGECPGSNTQTITCPDLPECPVVITWSDWGSWTSCSVTCGTGRHERTRTCPNGASCPGTNKEEKNCVDNEDCPAIWGDWNIGSCSVTCGSGQREDTRVCIQGNCVGDAIRRMQCNEGDCRAIWGDWNIGSCSVTCGSGQREDTRVCIQGNCVGDAIRRMQCNEGDCRVITWSDWGSWGSCSVTCGDGTRERIRTCPQVGECNPGSNSQTETCTVICQAKAGPWTLGSCSVTCGGGERLDTRVCIQGNCDEISLERTVDCNQQDCPSTWGEWEQGECSASCGISTREDRRICTSGNCIGDNTRKVDCNKPDCPVWSDWGSWSSCSVTCGRGNRQRTRACPAGADCSQGDNKEMEDCLQPVCPCTCTDSSCFDNSYYCQFLEAPCSYTACPRTCGICCGCGTWSTWSSWTQCSTSCGEGIQRRSRTCPFNKICDGEADEARYCPNQSPCTGGGGGSEVLTKQWSSWSQCSRNCGAGEQERRRECQTVRCTLATVDRRPCFITHCAGSDWTQCSKSCGWGSQLFRPCYNCPPTQVSHYRDCKTRNCQTPTCKLPFLPRYGESPSGCCERRASSCGLGSGANRIIGGKEALEKQWPWLGYFAAGRTRCGVTLINNNFAMTAAHCVDDVDVSTIRIRFGELSTGFWGGSNAQYTNVKRVSVPPGYVFPQNDIALLELETAMVYTHYVQAICLPKGEEMPVDAPCIVAGWGILEYGTEDQPNRQQEVEVRILHSSLCERAYYGNMEKDKMICAGHIAGGRDACQGDSGGPLMCQRCAGCEWTLQGIVSFGHKCAIKQHPGVYTKVDYYANWIDRITNSNLAYRSTPQSQMCTSI